MGFSTRWRRKMRRSSAHVNILMHVSLFLNTQTGISVNRGESTTDGSPGLARSSSAHARRCGSCPQLSLHPRTHIPAKGQTLPQLHCTQSTFCLLRCLTDCIHSEHSRLLPQRKENQLNLNKRAPNKACAQEEAGPNQKWIDA